MLNYFDILKRFENLLLQRKNFLTGKSSKPPIIDDELREAIQNANVFSEGTIIQNLDKFMLQSKSHNDIKAKDRLVTMAKDMDREFYYRRAASNSTKELAYHQFLTASRKTWNERTKITPKTKASTEAVDIFTNEYISE